MARSFRLWQKKRGNRRTGSRLLGGVGEVLFFTALLLIGTTSLAALMASHLLQDVESGSFLSDGLVFAALTLLAVVLIGGGGVLHSILQLAVSEERRSVMANSTIDLDLLRDVKSAEAEFPAIPREREMRSSPGVRLSYRLPVSYSNTWRFIGIAALWLISIGLASVLVVWAVAGFSLGQAEWHRVAIATLFVLVAMGATYVFVPMLLVSAVIGPTNVEVTDHPMRPGGRYRVLLRQAGRLTMKRLQLCLVCEEEATYQQGTNVRTETQVVSKENLFCRELFKIDAAVPFEHECEVLMSDRAMHSFKSSSNAIYWKLIVNGDVEGWPAFQRTFPVIVYPR